MSARLLGILIIALSIAACTNSAPKIGRWIEHDRMPTARSEQPAAVLGPLLFVPGGFGGETDFASFDTGTHIWESLPDLPQPRHHLMAASLAGQICIFGGAPSQLAWTPTAEAWCYNPDRREWKNLPDMPERRLAGSAVELGGSIYIAGGTGGSGATMRFDPLSGSWNLLEHPLLPTEHSAAIVLEHEIYLIGGRWSDSGERTQVQIFDPSLGVWRLGSELNMARAGFGAAVFEGRIWVFGGEVLGLAPQTLSSIEVFDPQEGAWLPAGDLPVPLHGVPAVSSGSSIYLLGGSDKAGAIQNTGRTLEFRP